jgi:hypothetical protein
VKKRRPSVGKGWYAPRQEPVQRRASRDHLPEALERAHLFAPAAAAAPSVVPYDDGLIDRCREQWRQGDWNALAQVPIDEVERHPQRARIALMVASAHQAQCQHGQMRLFVQLSRQWGCRQKLIARVLLAGVHNTLGRAAAIAGKHRERATHHFSEAVAPGVPGGGARWLAMHSRVRHQLEQLQMGAEATALLGGTSTSKLAPPSVPTPFRDLSDAMRKHGETVTSKLKEQAEQLAQARKSLEGTVKREMTNAVKQLEAFANLQRYFTSGDVMPEMHGWPVSPDFAVVLIQLLETEDFDAVVEFGSGSSTLLIAKTLARVSTRTGRQVRARHFAFEHLQEYQSKTAGLLRSSGFLESVSLVLAPLAPFSVESGETYSYYSRPESIDLSGLDTALGRRPRVLILVDGPPAATGPCARYPALEFCSPRLVGAAVTLLLDDYNRAEEKAVAQKWREHLEATGIAHEWQELSLEKGALVLRIPKV